MLLQFITGLSRETATPILWALAEKLKGRVPEEGLPIQECYDLVAHRPRPAYEKIYLTVNDELARMGLAFA